MYRYDQHDQRLVEMRAAQFRGQVERYLAGNIPEEEFKGLRLRNGLYLQRQAYMLRVAIPYGLLSSTQMRMLGRIARDFDRDYGHFTTRQNIQYNWPALEDVPRILELLASVQMHAIQTSGNLIRNISSDHLAGVSADELEDPRPWCELIRQWSTLHPEFSWLPRKFKIAVNGAAEDRIALKLHDVGLQIIDNEAGERGFRVYVGGGMGRTPVIGRLLRRFLPKSELLAYLEAILRTYNLEGRRDNIHKARIKILVKQMGIESFTQAVEREYGALRDTELLLTEQEIDDIAAHFAPPAYERAVPVQTAITSGQDLEYSRWYKQNTRAHKQPGYRIVFVSLKPAGVAPGDMTGAQMDAVADLAEQFSLGAIRTTHDQNLVLADVREDELQAVWSGLRQVGLASANIGTVNDMICCPGLEFCSLANASTIPVARAINERFSDFERLNDIGNVQLKMSGCMNACGHHHVGHIGILGVDKRGEQWYQFTLGGSPGGAQVALGDRLGAAVEKERVAEVVEEILDEYLIHRKDGEQFIDTYRRIGVTPFKERVYGHHQK
ncbi:MAG: sulfite reductase (NADPH) hemoprotein beta-component [Gammaproteobacteria bacterium]|jgi:sulfite reductase (NADPH) hemoprotein beta-component